MKFKYALNAMLSASVGLGLAGCVKQEDTKADADAIKVVTLLTRDNPPLPQIAEFVRDKVKKQNIELRIKYATDGLIPNKSVSENETDLNYFQHITYMQSAKEINNWDLNAIGTTFNSIFGAYSPIYKSLKDLPEGAKVVIPLDPSNGGRALNLLASVDLIELKPNTGAKSSVKDITANPKKLQIIEVEHALVPVSYKDSDLAIMDGAYTVHANLVPKRDALYLEENNHNYDAVLVANSKSQQKAEVQIIKDAFTADDTRDYVLKNYSGTVTWEKQ
ncbi:hypothetical protein AY605_11715 [Acinetobacter sp. SFD]|uniref:MetQ/NlpA family ABC transporter substrate-binding protein n=1 Tax=unclassified Acinetobacter TaxID=196816 RepID=UPI0007D057BE|nr:MULTISPECIES: MetQ/NlpA family ABC transporter substrate-binding protein [unclassified Acinetobacter]ATO21109.1 hypothetical protein BS636_15505 [Acinetobacter sp. LoGeW2-3]OAL83292.1 hypothetical protein AY605_11715 [Acinetobacter sp. SFD]